MTERAVIIQSVAFFAPAVFREATASRWKSTPRRSRSGLRAILKLDDNCASSARRGRRMTGKGGGGEAPLFHSRKITSSAADAAWFSTFLRAAAKVLTAGSSLQLFARIELLGEQNQLWSLPPLPRSFLFSFLIPAGWGRRKKVARFASDESTSSGLCF